ncbi:cell division protein WhiA [Streptomyces californicus]
MAPGGLRRGSRYVVRVVAGGDELARQTGLVDGRGRPIRGLPPQVVSGATCDAEAAWRGAFLAHGSLADPGRSSSLEVTCPGPEAALALVGAARRLSIAAKAREVRGVDRVVVRDGDAIGALLTRLGAHDAVLAWEERRMRREVRATANRLANFDDANLRRSARAAVAAGPGWAERAGDPRRGGSRAPRRRGAAAHGAQAGVWRRSWARSPTRR